MPEGWELKSVADLCSRVTSGGTPSRKRADYYAPAGQGTPWIKTKELIDSFIYSTEEHISEAGAKNSSAKLLPEGTVLMAMYGATVGKLGILGRPMACNQAACAMIVDPSAGSNRFLFYRLLHDRPALINLANGAAQQNLSGQVIKAFRFPCPPVAEQRRIADVLGALDDLIETNRALMDHCGLQVRSQYLRMMATAETGLMPFFEVFDVDFGAPFKGSAFNTTRDGRPLLRIRDLKTFTSDIWTTEQRRDETVISPGDVVVGMDAEFRPTFWLGAPSLLNQRVCRIRAQAAGLAFTREALVAPLAYIEGHKTGTTVSHLNKRDLAEIRVNIPTQEALGQFEAVAEPLRASIVELKRETDTLTGARDELLPLLLSRRVRVEDVTG